MKHSMVFTLAVGLGLAGIVHAANNASAPTSATTQTVHAAHGTAWRAYYKKHHPHGRKAVARKRVHTPQP